MGSRIPRFHTCILVLGLLLVGMSVAALAFGQEQPPQQNQPAPGGPMMQPQAGGGPMAPGMRGTRLRRGMAAQPRMQRIVPGMGGPAAMRGMPRMRAGEPMAGLLHRPDVQKALAITPEQIQKLDEIRFNTEKETIQHRSALQIARLELEHLTSAENPDRTAIDRKIQEAAQEEAALMRSSINARLNARGVLTAEQRTKLKQFMQTPMQAGRQPDAAPGRPARKTAPPAGKAPAAPAKPPAD